MEDYPNNSYAHKNKMESKKGKKTNQKKEIKKIVNGSVKTKNKSFLSKVAEVFVPDDIDNVKDYILYDVMIPAAKKFLSDSVDAILYGGSSKRSRGIADKITFIDYNKRYNRDRDRDRYSRSESRGVHSSTDVILESRADAEAVIMAMEELIDEYTVATIADFNELVGVTGQYTDNNYGWMDISSARVIGVRDGYVIRMPKAALID